MKVIKPMAVSSLVRCFEYRGKCWFSYTGMLMVGLGHGIRLYSEQELWPFWLSRPEASGPLDEGILRARAEYLVSGTAYPHGTDGRACAIEAQVGALNKRLLVFGDRYWDGTRKTPPQTFRELPITWERAYGGKNVAENPVGKGANAIDQDGARVHWLPNVEDPAHPVAAPGDRAPPAGFGPLDPMWPQRFQYQGTYDDAWLKNQFPAVAADTKWGYFNVAPADQQQDSAFTGAESYAFTNLHPSQHRLTGQLPGLSVRAFVTHRAGVSEKFKEIKTRLNTLWFFPDAERAILVFQGMHQIAEDDGSDIVHLLSAVEHMDRPRPAEHYLHVRDKRLDKEDGSLESLREEDLMPVDLAIPLINFEAKEDRALERGRKRAESERSKARQEIASHGLDPDKHAPSIKGEPMPEIKNLDDLLRARADMTLRLAHAKKHADADKAKSLADAKALFRSEGQDFGLIEREMAGLETRGPPKPFVDALIQSFRGHLAGQTDSTVRAELQQFSSSQALHTQWRGAESKQLMAYRLTAHYQPAAERAAVDGSNALRARVIAHRAAGGSFRGWDLTGADLSGLDLSGADMEGALMERSNLTGATLRDAKLDNAVLAHADLVSTQCQSASFKGANLGAARITKSDFEGANLSGAIFSRSRLDQVSWRHTHLDDIRLEEALIRGLDCSGARSSQLITFYRMDLRSFNFAETRLKLAAFIECDVSGVDFSQAAFEKAAFVKIKAMGARFDGMSVASGCFVQGCDLAKASFRGAVLKSLSFRGAAMQDTVFDDAVLCGSDFSECDLQRADFYGADARDTRFVRANLTDARFENANLMNGVLQHARLGNTLFQGANLFQSDFARARVAPGVRFERALCTRMRTLPRSGESATGERVT